MESVSFKYFSHSPLIRKAQASLNLKYGSDDLRIYAIIKSTPLDFKFK